MVDRTQLFLRERVLRGDAAVLTAHWSSHLAADFPPDNVATREDVRHVRAQELIDPDLGFFTQFDAGFFDRDLVGVRATAGGDQKLSARN